MNAIQRFFRRYIISTVGIILLFFCVNIALFFAVLLVGSASGSESSFSVQVFSDHLSPQGSTWIIDDTGLRMLEENQAWAMLLDPSGTVVWEHALPENLPRSYTSAEVASFSRWYLEDYPVKVWGEPDGGLLVIGFPPRSWIKYYYALEQPYLTVLCGGSVAVFLSNLLLVVFLILRNTRKVEKAMTPILQGIQDVSQGKAEPLQERGELAEICTGLNRAAAYMRQKDNTRAEWIRGISHDIRTPLSMVLGYASELEENESLPRDARTQAGIIRREGEKIKQLISDLNLTTKLEYALQPIHPTELDLVELCRQAVSEVINNGLPVQYELTFTAAQPGRVLWLHGDENLLLRMLENLIRNSIVHNPQGCKIRVSAGVECEQYVCCIADSGTGLSPSGIALLNNGQGLPTTQNGSADCEHGLGLKLVVQIAKAHNARIQYASSDPHGLTVKVFFPVQNG